MQSQSLESLELFLNSIKSDETRKSYSIYLKKFMEYRGLDDPFCQNNPRLIEREIIDFIIDMKSKKIEGQKRETNKIDPAHFTVFRLKPSWEKRLSKYWSQETIDAFKKRQEVLSTIPIAMRKRTKDKLYREGWFDAAGWFQKAMDRIFHPEENINDLAPK